MIWYNVAPDVQRSIPVPIIYIAALPLVSCFSRPSNDRTRTARFVQISCVVNPNRSVLAAASPNAGGSIQPQGAARNSSIPDAKEISITSLLTRTALPIAAPPPVRRKPPWAYRFRAHRCPFSGNQVPTRRSSQRLERWSLHHLLRHRRYDCDQPMPIRLLLPFRRNPLRMLPYSK